MVYHRNLGFLLLVGLSLAGRQPLKFSEHKTHEVNPTKVKGGCPKQKKQKISRGREDVHDSRKSNSLEWQLMRPGDL